jgi:hypothetical protein
MFSATGHVFGGTEGVGSHFLILHARNHFRRYRGRRVLFSCFALPNSFSAIPRSSGVVFMFCAPELIFGGTEGVGSSFHVLRSGLVFGGTVVIRPRFQVVRARNLFRLYRGRQIPFLCFSFPKMFLAVQRASGLVFMFCAPRHVFGDTEGVGSRFYVLRSRTRFDDTEGVGSHFHVLRSRTRFRRYIGRQVPFSCFALPDSFSVVPRVSGPVFLFCAPELNFGGNDGVGSRF